MEDEDEKYILHGYRVRVTVDYPIYGYSREEAEKMGIRIAENSYSACKVMSSIVIKTSLEPNNKFLFPED